MNFVHCLHIVLVIGKYIDVFGGIFPGGGGVSGGLVYVGRSFHGGIFCEGNLKRTEIITYMKGVVPSSIPRSLS